MYAVIQTGGKQYRVEPGQTVVVEKIEGEPGAPVVFDVCLRRPPWANRAGAPEPFSGASGDIKRGR